MKRPLIITIGIVIILLIVGLWVYLLLYGAPKEVREVFTNLGVVPERDGSVRVIDPNAEGQTQLVLGDQDFEQLTTRAVAGFGFTSNSNTVRYVERGTGHIYEIDLVLGIETQISLTTIPQTVEAVFSPEATSVAVTVHTGYEKEVSVGTLLEKETSLELVKLPLNAENVSFKDESTLYYTQQGDATTVGYQFDFGSLAQTELFTIPFANAQVHWEGDIYAYTKPTQYMEGFLYSASKGTITPVGSAQYGLTALIGSNYIVTSYISDDRYISTAVQDSGSYEQGILMLKEKCAFDPLSSDGAWCASPIGVLNAAYLEDWYKGAIVSNDFLWYTDLTTESSVLIGDLPTLSGRTIDVSGMAINTEGTLLLLGNKTDQSLWVYRIADTE